MLDTFLVFITRGTEKRCFVTPKANLFRFLYVKAQPDPINQNILITHYPLFIFSWGKWQKFTHGYVVRYDGF